ncbi:MAG: hypothetical protein VB106_05315 [Clostridiaceae bacterium]|nr:hypothetical protein [Clostridiaceae bacterium]
MKKMLVPNLTLNQYVDQDFPVKGNKVEVVTFLGKEGGHSKYLCGYFKVEVVKGYDGFVSFIAIGETSDEAHRDVWIMRTDDFNKAYDLKIRLSELCGEKVSERAKMHCYGSLQRKRTTWE